MLKETVIAVTVVTVAAAGALLPNPASAAGQQPIQLAACGGCSACNPCAAKGCNPCNPCNPCAAKGCNPCNPCNPCAG